MAEFLLLLYLWLELSVLVDSLWGLVLLFFIDISPFPVRLLWGGSRISSSEFLHGETNPTTRQNAFTWNVSGAVLARP